MQSRSGILVYADAEGILLLFALSNDLHMTTDIVRPLTLSSDPCHSYIYEVVVHVQLKVCMTCHIHSLETPQCEYDFFYEML